MKARSPFLTLWTLAVLAATTAFVLYLGLRVRSVELGYELGRAHARVGRLREVKRVLELELASHKTPERVDLVARSLLGMSEPSPDRILPAGAQPQDDSAEVKLSAPTDEVGMDELPSKDSPAGQTMPAAAAGVAQPTRAPEPASLDDDGTEDETP
jgi:cell division protein FtsL